MVATAEHLLALITRNYLESHDFNGLPISELGAVLGHDPRAALRPLVSDGLVTVLNQALAENPHIRRFDDPPALVQLDQLDRGDGEHMCAFPTASHLEETVPANSYDGEPFSLALGRGLTSDARH